MTATRPRPISRRAALAAGLAGAGGIVLASCASGGSSSTAPPAAGGVTGSDLATLADITIGEAVSANLDGKPVIVARPTATTAACFSAICTHQGCTVAPAGKQLQCPCHGSVFDASTGAVISGPAPRPLARIGVAVDAGKVVPAG